MSSNFKSHHIQRIRSLYLVLQRHFQPHSLLFHNFFSFLFEKCLDIKKHIDPHARIYALCVLFEDFIYPRSAHFRRAFFLQSYYTIFFLYCQEVILRQYTTRAVSFETARQSVETFYFVISPKTVSNACKAVSVLSSFPTNVDSVSG